MNAAEQMATRLMCDCFEKHLVTSTGTITWSERFIEHAAAMFEEFAKASKKEPRA